jgi:hypothetical protein
MNRAYRFSALKLACDLDFPELPAWDGPAERPADVVMRRGKVAPQLPAPDHVSATFHTAGRHEYLLTLPGTGRILIRSGTDVTIDSDPDCDPIDMRALLTGTVQALLWHQRGLLPLHASSVLVQGRAIAIAGPAACGKSTLAAMLAAHGHAILADDVCVVETTDDESVKVAPGGALLRLWADAFDRLGIATEGLPRAVSGKEQFLFPQNSCVHEPQHLAAIVAVTRRSSGALVMERLRGTAAVATLREVVHLRRPARALGRDPEIFAQVARLARAGVAVWRLRMPDDPACLAAAAAKILAVLET